MSNVKILVVEDHALTAQEIIGLLRKLGYMHIKWVDSGEEAVSVSRTFKPDLLLMDIDLKKGGMNGIEAVQHIQTKGLLPVIYVSGHEEYFKEAMKTSPVAFVDKPFNAADLRKRITLVLEKEHLRYQEYAFVKNRNANEKVKLSEILWIEANRVYSRVRLKDKSYTLTVPLKTCAERLQHTHFVRVHESFIVNVQHIESAVSINGRRYLVIKNLEKIDEDTHSLMDQGKNKIPLSRTYGKNLDWFFKKL